MDIQVKSFDELTKNELYALLRLRSDVFIVEQDCPYPDVDGKDLKAFHVLGWDEDTLVAYSRCFKPGDYFEEAAIGRVVVRENYRRLGYGHEITKASIKAVKTRIKAERVKISAQTYLVIFYESHGFKTIGEKYMEDGIPHIAMIKSL